MRGAYCAALLVGTAVTATGWNSPPLGYNVSFAKRRLTVATALGAFAGDGHAGNSGDGHHAIYATLNYPVALAFDAAGNMAIADMGNSRVRMVTSGTGYITTIAGGGGHPISSGVTARQTEFTAPWGLAYDAAGNLYISDADNNAVVMVAAVTTIVSVVAGNGTSDFNGEGGLAVDAALNQPCGLAIDSTGNLFIADWGNNRVRVVDSGSGVITTYAGGGYLNVRGFGGYGGDGGPATAARLSRPWGLAFDAADNLYVSDWGNSVIRKVASGTGIITTVAGTGEPGYSGDGGRATSAKLIMPTGIALDAAGNLYIADSYNEVIRLVSSTTHRISTYAGNGVYCYDSNGIGPIAGSQLCDPGGIAIDATGNVYVADSGAHRVDIVVSASPTKSPSNTRSASGSPSNTRSSSTSPSNTRTVAATRSATRTPTTSRSNTASLTASRSPTHTSSSTRSNTRTPTTSRSQTKSNSRTKKPKVS